MDPVKSRAWTIVAALVTLVAAHLSGPADALAEGPRGAIITVGKPVLVPRDGRDWDEEGRLVIQPKRGRGCTIEVLGPEATVLKELIVAADDAEPVSAWLSPGTYTLRVVAPNGATRAVPHVAIKTGHDTQLSVALANAKAKSSQPPRAGSKGSGAPIKRLPTWKPPTERKPPVQNFKPKGFGQIDKNLKIQSGKNKKKNRAKAANRRKGGNKGKGKRRGKGKGRQGKKK